MRTGVIDEHIRPTDPATNCRRHSVNVFLRAHIAQTSERARRGRLQLLLGARQSILSVTDDDYLGSALRQLERDVSANSARAAGYEGPLSRDRSTPRSTPRNFDKPSGQCTRAS